MTNVIFTNLIFQLQNSKLHFTGHDQMKIVLTILSSMTIFGLVNAEILPKYRYIMNPQMDLKTISLELDPSKAKSTQEGLI